MELKLLERVRYAALFSVSKLTLPVTGLDTPNHSATLTLGKPGVFHGVRTYILQSPVGQITGTHSISAGLDYPGVGPEHSFVSSKPLPSFPSKV